MAELLSNLVFFLIFIFGCYGFSKIDGPLTAYRQNKWKSQSLFCCQEIFNQCIWYSIYLCPFLFMSLVFVFNFRSCQSRWLNPSVMMHIYHTQLLTILKSNFIHSSFNFLFSLSLKQANKMGLPSFFCHNGVGDPLTTPPPAHCGIPPYQLDPKMGKFKITHNLIDQHKITSLHLSHWRKERRTVDRIN